MPAVSESTTSVTLSLAGGANSFQLYAMGTELGVDSFAPANVASGNTAPVIVTPNAQLSTFLSIAGVDRSTMACCFGDTANGCANGARSVAVYASSAEFYIKVNGSRNKLHGATRWTKLDGTLMRGNSTFATEARDDHNRVPTL